MQRKSLKLGILTLAAGPTLALAGCASGPSESDASFLSNPPSLESYHATASAAPANYTSPIAYPSGRPSTGSSCGSGGFS